MARSQVVVPNIMEELDFLTADGIKAAAAAKKAAPKTNAISPKATAISPGAKPSNGRVQIISVEKDNSSTSPEKKTTPPTVIAKKPEDKGFIGSYLKFLQGDTNHLGAITPANSNRGRKSGTTGGPSRAETAAATKRKNQMAQQQAEEEALAAASKYNPDPAKRGRSDNDDQGYVPNGGASAFDQTYQQQQQQQQPQAQYQAQYMHPLSIAGAHQHYQAHHMASSGIQPVGAPVPTPQMLPQSYTPGTDDGFNYFDFQFRPRW